MGAGGAGRGECRLSSAGLDSWLPHLPAVGLGRVTWLLCLGLLRVMRIHCVGYVRAPSTGALFLPLHTSRAEKPVTLILGTKFKFRGSRVRLLSYPSFTPAPWLGYPFTCAPPCPSAHSRGLSTPKESRASVDSTGTTVPRQNQGEFK